MGDRWAHASEALEREVMRHRVPEEKPLSDERLIALYKERMVEALKLERDVEARGFEVRHVYDAEDRQVEVWKKV